MLPELAHFIAFGSRACDFTRLPLAGLIGPYATAPTLSSLIISPLPARPASRRRCLVPVYRDLSASQLLPRLYLRSCSPPIDPPLRPWDSRRLLSHPVYTARYFHATPELTYRTPCDYSPAAAPLLPLPKRPPRTAVSKRQATFQHEGRSGPSSKRRPSPRKSFLRANPYLTYHSPRCGPKSRPPAPPTSTLRVPASRTRRPHRSNVSTAFRGPETLPMSCCSHYTPRVELTGHWRYLVLRRKTVTFVTLEDTQSAAEPSMMVVTRV